MNEQDQNACGCNPCVGAGCNCGCQVAASNACACGPQCRCEGECVQQAAAG